MGATAEQTSRPQAISRYSASIHSHCRSEIVNTLHEYLQEKMPLEKQMAKSRGIIQHPCEHMGSAGCRHAAGWDRNTGCQDRGPVLLPGTYLWVVPRWAQHLWGPQADLPRQRGRGPFFQLQVQQTFYFFQLSGIPLTFPHYRMQECTCTLARIALSLK